MGLTERLPTDGMDAKTTRGRRGTALALAVLLAGVGLAPAAAGFHGEWGITTSPWLDHCEDVWTGGIDGGSHPFVYRACLSADADLPDWQYGKADRLEDEPQVHDDACGGDFEGLAANQSDTWVGVCAKANATAPSQIDAHAALDLEECQAPEDQQARDPTVFVADGGVAACAYPILEPGVERPNASVSPEPCTKDAVDPEARVGGGGAEVCMELLLLDEYGSPQVNLVVQAANATAHAAVENATATVDDAVATTWWLVDHLLEND